MSDVTYKVVQIQRYIIYSTVMINIYIFKLHEYERQHAFILLFPVNAIDGL